MTAANNNLNAAAAAVIAACFLALSTSSLAACDAKDMKTVLAIQASFSGQAFRGSFHDRVSHPTDGSDSWDYVRCKNGRGRVTAFSMSGDFLGSNPPNRPLPPSLGDLTALEDLSFLFMPSLVGPIPPQLSRLKRLKSLVISHCNISGPVPSFLSQMPSLQVVDLRNNMLEGTIPPSLGSLANLNSLTLFANRLTGTIPPTLFGRLKRGGSSSARPFLYLSQNKLTGTIPPSFADVDFGWFYVSNNRLTGDASFLLGKNKRMDTLILDYNKFAFDLTKVEYPATLTFLSLSNNEIYGSISDQITEVPNLVALDLSNNKLCGKIPSGGYFKNFTADAYANNQCLCGTPLPPCK